MSPRRDDDPPSGDDGSERPARPPAEGDPAAPTDVRTGRDTDGRSTGPHDATGAGSGSTAGSQDGHEGQSGNSMGEPPEQRQSLDGPSGPPSARRADDGGDDWARTVAVDVASSALAVVLVGFFLFTVSGLWPPMVAVESASMTPQMKTGDLVFVMEEHRFSGEAEHADTGVVTARAGAASGYEKFSEPGDVVVFEPDGNSGQTPIIHRAMFWVEAGERWYDRADRGAVASADSCDEMANCPAPHAGFITKGDANGAYDQVGPNPHSGPVKPAWVVGTAEERIPALGCIRLRSQDCSVGLSTGPGFGVGLPALGHYLDLAAVGLSLPAPDVTVPDARFVDPLV